MGDFLYDILAFIGIYTVVRWVMELAIQMYDLKSHSAKPRVYCQDPDSCGYSDCPMAFCDRSNKPKDS